MLKSFLKTISVLVTATAIVGGATVLSRAKETVSVTIPITSGKGDRLDIRAVGPDCSRQAWPYYEASCVKDRREAMSQAKPTRIVTADRVPATIKR
ncbi:MAG: hypothetical protein ABWY66_10825 [Xanthobacteraceae bacterium]|jgi:hypothetical protein